MPIGEICNREVVVSFPGESAVEAAKLMRQYHVGDLVIVEQGKDGRVPIGILTDRDLVVEVMAKEMDPARFTVADVMSRDLLTAREQDGIFETIQRMRTHGVRRVPVVDKAGALLGIVSVEDLFSLLAEEMTDLVRVSAREQAVEVQARH
jgi:CBS domain-containing protein